MNITNFVQMRKFCLKCLLFVFIFSVNTLLANQPTFKAVKKDRTISLPDTSWNDPYAYLQDDQDKDAEKFIKKEISYHKSMGNSFFYVYRKMAYNSAKYDQISYQSAPYRIGDWYYYYASDRFVPLGVDFRVHKTSGKTQMLINYEDFHSSKRMIDLRLKAFSPDDKYMAYCANFDGTEDFILLTKIIKADHLLKERIPHVNDMVWLNNSKGFIYLQENKKDKIKRLALHLLETDIKNDKILYENSDPACFIGIKQSRDKSKVFLIENKKNHHKIYQIDLVNPQESPCLLYATDKAREVDPDCHKGKYFLKTDEKNPDFDLIQCSDSTFKSEKIIYSGSSNKPLKDYSVYNNYFAITELINGMPRVKTINRTTGKEYSIDFIQKFYSLGEYFNYEPDTDTLNLVFDSYVIPTTVMKLNMKTKKLDIIQKISPYKNYDSKAYAEEMVYVKGPDSVAVPMVIVYKKDLFKGNNPCLLYVYGSYGDIVDHHFSQNNIIMMDRGWIYAYPQVRGGGEYGSGWYDQGRRMIKKNTFTDIINCAKYLIFHQYTSREKLAIEGASAGGMAVAAVINERPDLFRTAILSVPAADAVTPLIDHSDPSACFHHEELGDPLISEERDYLFSYSPYHNIKAQDYPHIYASTGINDPRVPFYLPLKWVAKLRELKTDNNYLIINIANYRGHFDTFDEDKKDAFLIWTIELDCK